jgi:aminoglycoside phosphotransferase (APT) family kinase protein
MFPQPVEVLPQNRLDEAALARFLRAHLPEYEGQLRVRQFPGGFSNPTYALDAIGRDGRALAYVLRKRPAVVGLPSSAHRVDREFRVLRSLGGSDVPVPRVRVLCEDPEVLGTSFFVMDRVQGRLFSDPTLPGCSSEERKSLYASLAQVLARLHAVDCAAVGLADFGKPGDFLKRQVDLWTRQYIAAQTDDLPEMRELGDWLAQHIPAHGRTSIVHGDYRFNNVLAHPAEPRIAAVLDWELSTLGDPLCDLAYCCLCYYIGEPPVGFGGADPIALGIPTEAEFLQLYCDHADIVVRDWNFYLALQLYKSSSILQGVYKRALQGSGPAAGVDKKPQVVGRARLALSLIERGRLHP